MPPQVLAALPGLPEELEYRFIGSTADPARHARAHDRRLPDGRGAAVGGWAGADALATLLPFAAWSPPRRPASSACPTPSDSCAAQAGTQPAHGAAVALPNRADSLKFAVLGDFGTGDREQYQLGEQMAKLRGRFPFELVITVGDNIYGSERPQDMKRKFENPYKPLLDAGVKFYASLGNHDAREQRDYKLFNMDGKTYYTLQGAEAGRPVLRARERLSRAGADRVAGEGAGGLGRELEDPVLPPPALFVRRDARLRTPSCAQVLEPLFVEVQRQRRLHRPRSLLRAHQAAEGHRVFRRRVGRQAAARATSIAASGPDGRRLRHRPGVPGGRDRRRPAVLQRHLAQRHGHRLRRHRAAEARSKPCLGGLASSASPAPSPPLSLPVSPRRPSCIFLAIAPSVTMRPTSRRPSSSSLRRLWLPTNAAVPSRTIARTCSRRSGELPRLDARQPLVDLADDADLDAGLEPLLKRRSISLSETFAS